MKLSHFDIMFYSFPFSYSTSHIYFPLSPLLPFQSNIGSIGGTCAVPLVLVPQVAIGAMGKMQTLPRYPDAPSESGEKMINQLK